MYRLATKRTEKTSLRKRERKFFFRQTVKRARHWSCYVLLFTEFVNY